MKSFLIIFLAVLITGYGLTTVYGADIATVTKLNTVLRESPSEGSESVLIIKKGRRLALIDLEETGGWLNVIDINTAKEGWVKAKHVSIRKSKTKKQPQIFTEEKIADDTDPEIMVKNESTKTIALKVGKNRYDILPKDTMTVSYPSGIYDYYATAPGVDDPAIGKENFASGHRYSWRFWIEYITVPVGRRSRK